ncbi:DUF6801 domain-containing protein [Amycolatopsis sp. NPDC026612]|uniref:DUF6801 domain-containing protein n=1 Tax=Amycolatopsis sp. NPDC026612 TaxID=3155466 RepID=UPI0033E02AE5
MRIGTAVAAALLVTGAAAGTANAATATPQTGALTYTCTYPGIPPQGSAFTGSFEAADQVPPGGTFTLTGAYLSHVMSPAVRSLFTAAGYDRVQGSFGASITATNAAPDTAFISGSFPEQPIAATGSLTFTEIGDQNLTFTAGAAGPIRFTLGPQVYESLQFHRRTTGTWVAWSSSCTLKITSPAQNTAFQPDIAIS